MQRRWTNPRALYLAALFFLTAAALAPTNPVTSALASIHGPLETIIAPVSQAGSYVSTHLRPAGGTGGAAPLLRDADYAELERDYTAALNRVQTLERAVAALEERTYYGSAPDMIRLHVSRLSADTGSGTIAVRAGSRDDVTRSTVVAAHIPDVGLQLIGEVVRVEPLISTIHVITHEHYPRQLIEGIVVPPEGITDERELANLPRCQLRPSGSALIAPDVAVTDAEKIAAGHLVLLSDDTWPETAQMLIIGRVTRVESTEQPLHKRVTVAPAADLTRLGSFILRIEQTDQPGAEQ
jgi:cell shape-determining protein MreC